MYLEVKELENQVIIYLDLKMVIETPDLIFIVTIKNINKLVITR